MFTIALLAGGLFAQEPPPAPVTDAGSVSSPASTRLQIPHEEYQLENGMNVILIEDHALPTVTINVWYGVGSKDELVGRTGFAHLFEHLMFMGTTRLPGSGFDDLMEAEGGWNNAWTSEDATDYYSVGPSQLLETLLWMDADRMDGLSSAMTQEKLDLQREVVRNERRQTGEDAPYGVLWLEMNAALYPEGHPYAHSVIGSHEDLQAATVQDVVDFFDTWYVPNNASLVVAGDFDPAQIKPFIAGTFGQIAPGELPERATPETPDTPVVPLLELEDQVQIPMTTLMWHSPAALQEGDAAYDLLASILAGGRSSRLYQRMVHSEQMALEINAYQFSQMHSSIFMIQGLPTETHTIEQMEDVVFEELQKLAEEGPTQAELDRVVREYQVGFLSGLESLDSRASTLNRYHYLVGTTDYLEQDLARYTTATPADVQAAAAALTRERALTARVRPEKTEETAAEETH
ncbi:MAG: pitrilysin family protein [Myxococcota bacterium]|nr:pitrilysin family protein [Myxococcota bacterium]